MSRACTSVLVGVVSPVLEILLPSKMAKFPFQGMDYMAMVIEKFNQSESAQKNHASRDRCHVHVHQFWWVSPLQFRRFGYLSKTAKFHFRGMDYSPWSSKNLIYWNRLKKFMQVGVDIKCMHTNIGSLKIENVSVIIVTRQRYRLLQRYYNIKIGSKNQHHPLHASHVNYHFVKYCTLGVLY